MPYFPTSEEWQRQSALLLRACPTTTRITTKYHVPQPSDTQSDAAAAAAAAAQPQPPQAYLELKTYDPATGACLKYKTDKAAEVGRLIASLGTLGRDMAALPQIQQDVIMNDAPPSGADTPVPEVAPAAADQKPAAGKKKKKGKK